jgi:hypothetical protein
MRNEYYGYSAGNKYARPLDLAGAWMTKVCGDFLGFLCLYMGTGFRGKQVNSLSFNPPLQKDATLASRLSVPEIAHIRLFTNERIAFVRLSLYSK